MTAKIANDWYLSTTMYSLSFQINNILYNRVEKITLQYLIQYLLIFISSQ
jgi:hypothetical protein